MIEIKDKDSGASILKIPGSTLESADLSRLRLRYAGLSGSNLHRASLRRSNLWGADLRGADLRAADLREAILCRADLTGAKLAGANLDHAAFDELTRWPSDFDPSWELLVSFESTATAGP